MGRGRVSRVVQELRKLEPEGVPGVLVDPRFRTSQALAEFLARCEEVLFAEPRKGLELARHAPELAGLVRPRRDDDLARAHATLAHALRARGHAEEAQEVFSRIPLGGLLPATVGYVTTRRAYLLIDLHDYDAALEACERALSHLVPGTADHAVALVFRGIARARRYRDTGVGRLSRACADYRAVLASCRANEQPRIHYAAVHNLGLALLLGALTAADLREVFATLKNARALLRRYRIRRRSVPHAKLRWAEALALVRIGATRRAEVLLTSARADLLELGAMLDVARVSLDLGELYRDEGRWDELRRISADVVHLDRSKYGLGTLAALLLWRQACLEETLDDAISDHVYHQVYGVARRR